MGEIPGNQRAYLPDTEDNFSFDSSQSYQSSYSLSGVIDSSQETIQDESFPYNRVRPINSTQDSNESESGENTLEDDILDIDTIEDDTINNQVVERQAYRKFNFFNILFRNFKGNDFRSFIFDLIDKYYEKVNLTCNFLMAVIIIPYLIVVFFKNFL